MLIDWFTVGAQALNFLILVWLLKRYLYRPLLAAIAAREKKIAATLVDAAAQETKAQVAGEALRQRNEDFERARADLMRKATEDGATERKRLVESARVDSQLLRSKLAVALDAERAELGRQLSLRAQAEVIAVARKALSDLAGSGLEDRMIEVFIERLGRIDADIGATAVTRPADAARAASVRSAFELAAAGRGKIAAAIRERLGPNIAVEFATSPDLVCGVELTVDGVKLAWSVADYLSMLARDVALLATAELVAAPLDAAHVH